MGGAHVLLEGAWTRDKTCRAPCGLPLLNVGHVFTALRCTGDPPVDQGKSRQYKSPWGLPRRAPRGPSLHVWRRKVRVDCVIDPQSLKLGL